MLCGVQRKLHQRRELELYYCTAQCVWPFAQTASTGNNNLVAGGGTYLLQPANTARDIVLWIESKPRHFTTRIVECSWRTELVLNPLSLYGQVG